LMGTEYERLLVDYEGDRRESMSGRFKE